MKYAGMPMGMWILFRRSFRNHLVSVLGLTETEAARATTVTKLKYREIIAKLPEFEKADRFKTPWSMRAAYVILSESTRWPPVVRTATAGIGKRQRGEISLCFGIV